MIAPGNHVRAAAAFAHDPANAVTAWLELDAERSPFATETIFLDEWDKSVPFVDMDDDVDMARDDRVSRRCFELDHLGAGAGLIRR